MGGIYHGRGIHVYVMGSVEGGLVQVSEGLGD